MPFHLDTFKNKRYVLYIVPLLALVMLGTTTMLSGTPTQAAIPSGGATLPPTTISNTHTPFDCSRIHELGIDKQMNMRASQIMIACGYMAGGSPAKAGGSAPQPFRPLPPFNYGGTDANTILPDGASPHVSQSESFVWGN